MLDVLDRDRVGAIVLASGTSVIVAPAAGTGIVDGRAPMTEAAVASAGGTTTATGTHTMTAASVSSGARFRTHGIVSDTTVGWRVRSS